MTNEQITATTEQLTAPSQVLAARLQDLTDADLQLVGRTGAEFDSSFDNAFSNIA